MALQINSSVVVPKSFPIQQEDSTSNFANLKWFNNLSETEHIVLPYIQKFLNTININELVNLKFKQPIKIIVEFDEVHYLAECIELPLYSTGLTKEKAIQNLKEQIEETFFEIKTDSNLSDDWLNYKTYLLDRIQ